MKISLKGVLAFAIFAFLSCSKDDGGETVSLSESEINVILIGEAAERVYQYSYNSTDDAGIQTDLTQELGLENNYLALRQQGNELSFYTFALGKFSLFRKNVETGVSSFTENFYSENFGRTVLWGTNGDRNIYLGFFEPQNSSNFGVLTIDIETGVRTDLKIEDAIQTSYAPIFHQGKLILTYRDVSANYKVAIVDTDTNTIQNRLEFGALVPNIFIDEFGDVVILKSNRGENYSYAIYDPITYESSADIEFSLTRFFDPGFLNARLLNQELYYYQSFVQPAEVQFGPASFDLNTNLETVVDMIRIVNEIENNNGKSVRLISQGIDEESGVYLLGYANLNNSNTIDGGMIIVSFEGELIKNIELPFVPSYFLIKE